MKKRLSKILLGALVLCLALSAAVTAFTREQPLHYILDSVISNDVVYGIDDDEETVRFFAADTSGEIQSQFTVDREDGGGVYNVFDYISLDNGGMYVYGAKIDTITNTYLDESVYYCNFKKGRLEHYRTLPVVYPDGQNNLSVKVENGQVTYLTYEFLDDLVVTVHRMDSAGQVEDIHQLYFDPYVNIYDYAYSDKWKLVFITPDNKIYRSLENGSSVQVYPKDDGTHQLTDFYYPGGDWVYVTDAALGQVLQIDLNTGTAEVILNADLAMGDGYQFSDFEKIRYKEDGEFCATVQLDGDSSGLGLYRDGVLQVFESLTKKPVVCWKTFFWTLLWTAVVALVLLGICQLFLMLTRRRFPILAKMILALLPVVILCALVTRYYTQRNLTSELMNAQYRELYQNSQNFLAGVDTFYWTDIDPAEAYETDAYFDFQDLFFNRNSTAVQLLGSADEGSSDVNYFSYLFAYQVKDGKLYSYFCDPQPVNTPVEYKQSRELVEDFYECVEKGQPVKGEYRDKFGNWSVVLVPVFDDEGNVTAVLESGMSKVLLDYNIRQEIRYLTVVNMLILAAMMIFIAVILTYGLYPLKRLKRGVEEMLDGHLGVTVPVRGRDEVAEISEVFNRMSRSIQNHFEQMERFNRASFRFIPSQIFRLLHKEGVADVQKGDNTTQSTTALSFHTVTFHTRMRTMTGEEMYRFINRILSVAVPAIQEKQGVISQFENAGIEGFFTDSSDTALSCAVSICQRMLPLGEEPGFEGVRPAIGLNYGSTKLGIIGTDERLEAVAISESTNLAQFLQKMAPKYSARILVTGTLLEQIPDARSRYHLRWIGFVSLSATEALEPIYDCFDGDTPEERAWKAETKEQFERGVALYCARSYYEARKMFIEVLKSSYQDFAAKEYLFLCDRRLNQEDTGDQVYLVRY